MPEKKKHLVTVTQLAKIKGVTRQAILKAIAEGRIKGAYKIGNNWVIERGG